MGNMGPVWDQEHKSVKDILLDKNTIARKHFLHKFSKKIFGDLKIHFKGNNY